MTRERDLAERVDKSLIPSGRAMLLRSRSHLVSSTEGSCWKVREGHTLSRWAMSGIWLHANPVLSANALLRYFSVFPLTSLFEQSKTI